MIHRAILHFENKHKAKQIDVLDKYTNLLLTMFIVGYFCKQVVNRSKTSVIKSGFPTVKPITTKKILKL